MRPLLNNEILTFLKRFNNFIDAEIRSIEVISPINIKVFLSAQDQSRAFDWIEIEFDFNNINNAKLPNLEKLEFIDMSNGISLLYHNSNFYFGIDIYNNSSNVKDSIFYIDASSLKYKENNF